MSQHNGHVIMDINSNDVLCGRGGATNNHTGNQTYRRIVAAHQDEYLHSKKRDKRQIACKIVQIIHQRGGRFLKKSTVGRGWIDVGEKKATEKTSQALREGLDVRRQEVTSESAQGDFIKRKVGENFDPQASQNPKKRKNKSSSTCTGEAQHDVSEQWEVRLRDMVSQTLPVGMEEPPLQASMGNTISSGVAKPRPKTFMRTISTDVVVPV